MQQDAHEFLNFLINHINETIIAERNQANQTTLRRILIGVQGQQGQGNQGRRR
jgi:ubiquitin C-terminal hydrolase